MTDKSAFPAPEGDVENGKIITQPDKSVNRKNSLSEKTSDIAYLSAVERGDMETAIRETSPLREGRARCRDGRPLSRARL